jgi:hypothetical protein
LLYTSEILSTFIHSEFTRRLNPLDDSRVLLKAAGFKKLNHIFQQLVLKVYDLSLAVCVFLFVYELNFMTDKEYLAESSDNILWQADPDL